MQKGKAISLEKHVVMIAVDVDVHHEAEPQEPLASTPVEQVEPPASTQQEPTPKQASEARHGWNVMQCAGEPNPKQDTDATEMDEGGQMVGESAWCKVWKTHNHRYMSFWYLIWVILFTEKKQWWNFIGGGQRARTETSTTTETEG